MDGLISLLPILAIAAIFWLLLIRPQRRRQAEAAAMQRSVEPGDEVMIAAGIYGTVLSVEEENAELEVAPGVVLKVVKAAIVRVVPPQDPEPDPTADHTDHDLDDEAEGA